MATTPPKMTYEDIQRMITNAATTHLVGRLGDRNPKAAAAAGHVSMAFKSVLDANPELKEYITKGTIDMDALADSIALAVYKSVTFSLFPGGMPGMEDIQLTLRKKYRNPRQQDFTVTGIVVDWTVTSKGWRRFFKRELGMDIRPVIVRKGEEFTVARDQNGRLHVENKITEDSVLYDVAPDNIKFGYAMLIREDGVNCTRIEDVLVTHEAIQKRMECSESYKTWVRKGKKDSDIPIWIQWFEEMTLKTIVTYAVKHGPFLLDPGKFAFVGGAMEADDSREEEEATTSVVVAQSRVINAEPTSTQDAAMKFLETGAADEEPLFTSAPTEQEKVVIETQKEPEVRNINAPSTPDAAKFKARAFELEGQLPVGLVNNIRTQNGIEVDADIVKSKYRMEKVMEYGKALRAAVDAQNRAALDHPPVTDEEPPPIEDEDLPM